MRRAPIALLLAGLLGGLGCKTRPSDAKVDAAGTASAASASPSASSTASARASVDAAVSPTASVEARRAYATALAGGRKSTTAKKYDEAIQSFSDALSAVPDDPRALAERGYARLLAGDADHAKDDLEHARAVDAPTDKKLLAQIEYNLGLACDALADAGKGEGYRGEAVGHYRRSNDLSPSKAAQSKMGGCPMSWRAPVVATFDSKATAMSKYGPDDEWVTLDSKASPGVLVRDQVDAGGTDVLLPLDAGRYAHVEVGATATWRCGTLGTLTVTRVGGAYKLVYQANLGVATGAACFCGDTPCSAGDEPGPACTCAEPLCPTGCGAASAPAGEHSETWVDASKGDAIWATTVDVAYAADVHAEVDMAKKRFTATGLGCVADLPLGAK